MKKSAGAELLVPILTVIFILEWSIFTITTFKFYPWGILVFCAPYLLIGLLILIFGEDDDKEESKQA